MGGPRVVIVGAGFGGLGAARELRRRGIDDIVVLERAASVGGVWRDNTYPGAACDVPSPLYSWSWALNPRWSHRYCGQAEILGYLRDVAAREGLADLVVTGTTVTDVVLDETGSAGDSPRWRVITDDQTVREADLVVAAVGQLSNPVVPDLPGVDSFEGPVFHSARWRHDVDLRGRRVAVVGTGASAVQFVPGIVEEVGSMTIFQRSAPYVVPRPDTEYGGLHRRVFDRVPGLLGLERRAVFAATELLNGALEGKRRWSGPAMRLIETAWRLHLRRQVRDHGLRGRLRPDHPIGCKRILFSNTWYPALARDHVEVVTGGVAAVEPDGVRTDDGVHHPADVLIWGTGFQATDFLAGIEVRGRDGRSLHEHWDDGARAHLGLAMPGFPNLAVVYGPNTNLGGSSIIAMMEAQAGWIAEVAVRLRDGASEVEVRTQVAEAFDAEMQARLRTSVWAGCQSWYHDGDRISTNWPGTVSEYRRRTATVDWDELTVR